MEENNYHVKIETIENDLQPLVKIYLKPKFTIYLFLIIGIMIIVLTHNLPGILAGMFFCVLALYNIFMVKDRVILDMYQDYIVLYDAYDQTMCYKIFYDDIETYTAQAINSTSIYVLNLKSGDSLEIPTANTKVFKQFQKVIPEKDKFTRWKKEVENRSKAHKKQKRAQKNKGD